MSVRSVVVRVVWRSVAVVRRFCGFCAVLSVLRRAVGAAGGTVGQKRGGQRAAAGFPQEKGLPIQGARQAAKAQGPAQETAGRRGRGTGRQEAETRTEGAGPQPPRPTSTRQATRTNQGGGRHAARYRKLLGASRSTRGEQRPASRPQKAGRGAPRRGTRRGGGAPDGRKKGGTSTFQSPPPSPRFSQV